MGKLLFAVPGHRIAQTGERGEQTMWNNGNDCGCLWIILIIILLCCCCGGGMLGNNNCGCGNSRNNDCCC